MKHYEVSPELMQAIANILSSLPYGQVSTVADAIKQLKAVDKAQDKQEAKEEVK